MNRAHLVLGLIVALTLPGRLVGQGGKGLPSPVSSGLQAYKAGGPGAAIKAWLADSPIAGESDLVSKTLSEFEAIQRSYGPFVGYEALDASPVGTRAIRCYLMLLYERGPVYIYFDAYRTRKGWVVTGFLFNTKPETILPQHLLSR